MLVVDPHHQRSQAASLPIRIRPIMMYGSETWAAPPTVMERLDCTERKLLRLLLGYFWPRVCYNVELCVEVDMVYRRMARGKRQRKHVTRKSSPLLWSYIKEIGRSPCSTSSEELEEATWPKTDVVKEDLRTLGVDRQFRRDVRFRRMWNSDEWIDSVQALAEDREGWAERMATTEQLSDGLHVS
ncbi:hypothetical protein RB195_023273 [Necator americanus]|uniref:Transposase n=1 Tax=Necator americanus TaxID=51031 RepID=A0ABR1EIH2_NECAM